MVATSQKTFWRVAVQSRHRARTRSISRQRVARDVMLTAELTVLDMQATIIECFGNRGESRCSRLSVV